MKVSIWTQQPEHGQGLAFSDRLAQRIEGGAYKKIWVAVAYATIAGIRELLSAISAEKPQESWWLIGLDDAITQPGAIELIQKWPNAHLRVATYENKNFRFHPKVYGFGDSSEESITLAVIGSANLTSNAWTKNGEAISVVEAENKYDRKILEDMWRNLWSQGRSLSDGELSKYRGRYESARKIRTSVLQKSKNTEKSPPKFDVIKSDAAEVDPSLANTCWIECGNVTAKGRELEFKAEQGLFFGLDRAGLTSPCALTFRVSSGENIQLNMVYQGNHMWRLQMNNNVPEVRSGLRPTNPDGSLGRSPYVAVFQKNGNEVFSINFINLASKEFDEIRKKSAKNGTVGKTSARQYGWF